MIHYLTFDEVGITIAVIGIALAFVVLVWNAVKAIHDWRLMERKPTSDKIADLDSRVSYLEGCCSEVQSKLANDYAFQQDSAEMDRLLLRSVKQLLKHGIDGNDKDGLKAMEDAIDVYLLDHAK